MQSKKLVVIICMLVIASVFPIVTTSVASDENTIYVDDDAPPEWYDATHVRTIQEGIDASSINYEVYVFSGLYYENLYVDKSIVLNGEEVDTTIITGAIELISDNVTIDGFTIKNWGIYISTKFNTIQNNNITDSVSKAISLGYSSSNNLILNNTIIFSQKNGIELFHSNDNKIFNNLIMSNEKSGMIISSSMKNIIEKNNIKNNNLSGIVLTDSNNNTFTNNTLINNLGGIQLGFSSENEINQNIISNNIYDGIVLHSNSENNNITKNSIIDNNRYGIYLMGTVSNQIFSNNFIQNKINAFFTEYGNTWDKNYWNRPRLFPKLIFGNEGYKIKIEIDWNPAQKPYDIP